MGGVLGGEGERDRERENTAVALIMEWGHLEKV